MLKAISTFRAIALIGLSIVLLPGCTTVQTTDYADRVAPVSLSPVGKHADSPATVEYVEPGSPADGVLAVGDRITKLDGNAITSTWDFVNKIGPLKPLTATIVTAGGAEKTVVSEAIYDPKQNKFHIFPFRPGEPFLFSQTPAAYNYDRNAAFLNIGGAWTLVSAGLFQSGVSGLRYLELLMEIRVDDGCADCRLDNIAIADQTANSFLTAVSPEYAAWALYPTAGQAPQMMAVPPPTPIGATASTMGRGTFNAYTYGNRISGTFQGSGITTYTPTYDYTLTNMAMAYNLGAMIQQSRIQADTVARQRFVQRRTGNLRLGKLNPGERLSGYVFFQVPANMNGPFLVLLQGKQITGAVFEN